MTHSQPIRRWRWIWCLLAAPLRANAEDITYRYFDLPGQALQAGLVELALQADVTVIANHQLIRDYQSASLIGPHTPEQALKKLLARTPLDYRYDESTDAFVIVPREIVAAPAETDTSSAAEERLEEVVVYAPTYPFRYNTLANTQFDAGTAVYDNSRFHTVLPAQLIADLMPLDIGDLLQNGSGISPGDGRGDTNDDFYMRGFPRHALYLDGFRVENTTGGRFLPDNIERVEILKGPSTIRYGQGEPGGMVNLVRKKPLDEALAQLNVSFGGNGLRKIAADVSDQLLEDELSYRVNVVDFRQEFSADIHDIEQQLLAPSLRWRPDSASDIYLSYEFQKTRQRTVEEFQLIEADPEGNSPAITFDQLVRRKHPDFEAERHFLMLSGQRFFAGGGDESGWRLKGNFVWQEEERLGVRGTSDYLNSDILFNPENLSNLYMLLIPGGRIAIPVLSRANPNNPFDPLIYIGEVRSIYDEESSETGLQSTFGIDGTLAIGAWQHHLSVGVDWRRQDLFQSYTVESRRPLPLQSWPESQSPPLTEFVELIFAPDRPLGALEWFEYRQISDEYGFYVQDTIDLTERLSVTGGARFSWIDVEREYLKDLEIEDFEPVGKIRLQSGMNYQLSNQIELFGNYAQGLRANQSKGGFGHTVSEPELSDQWEIGLKGYFLEGRLSAALAAYRINKTNIYWVDSFAATSLSLREYGQKVVGMDFDFTYQLSTQTQLIGSFSAQDNELTYGPYAGNIPAASTPNTASFFLRHALTDAFSADIGGHYVAHRYADHSNNFELDAFFILNAGAQYQTRLAGTPVTVQLKVKNLLDEKYYSDVVAGIRMNEGEERQIVAGIKLDFR
jgi:Outer membrane receptor proteins, mostly Fe transport